VLSVVSKILKSTIANWRRHRVSRLAAALSFYMVFSLAPLLFIIVVFAGTVLGATHTEHLVKNQLQLMVGTQGAQLVDTLVAASRRHVSAFALAAGGVLVVASAFGVFLQVQDALDEIWEIPEHRRGNLWETFALRLHALVVVGALAILAMVSLVVADAAGLRAGLAVNVVALMIFLLLTYRVLPQTDVGWKSSTLAAAITGLILLFGEALISLYFTHVHPASNYGTVGAFILVLLWIYYSAQLLLFGAELTRTIETTSLRRSPRR
jgi:membrane protein